MRSNLLRLFCALVVASLLAACSSSSDSPSDDAGIGRGDRIPTSDIDPDEASMAHVHGIGRNPADDSVYVATHHGLWRIDQQGPELVGRHLHDFMGFSVVGPDRFVASGHPGSADELPPHLGLIESRDAGTTWTSRSLLGEADFHALRSAGASMYGWNSQDGALVVSADGTTWDTLVEDVMMLDVAADPSGGTTVVASVATGPRSLELQRSTDSGRTFASVRKSPQLARFAWSDPDTLWGFDVKGVVWLSDDDGETWKRIGTVGAMPDAVAASRGELLAAAGGSVLESTDDGRTWQRLASYD